MLSNVIVIILPVMFPKLQTLWKINMNSLALFQQFPNCNYNAICVTCYLCNVLFLWLFLVQYSIIVLWHTWNTWKWQKLAHFFHLFVLNKNGGKAYYTCYKNVTMCHVFTVADMAHHKIILDTTEILKLIFKMLFLVFKDQKTTLKDLILDKPNHNLAQTILNHVVQKMTQTTKLYFSYPSVEPRYFCLC